MSEIGLKRDPHRFVSGAVHKSAQPACVAPNGVQHWSVICPLQPRAAEWSYLPVALRMIIDTSLLERGNCFWSEEDFAEVILIPASIEPFASDAHL